MKRVFRLPWTRRRIDADLGAEFQFHLQERIEQFVAAGMSRDEAEAEARRRFGDFEAYRHQAQRIDEETMRQQTTKEFLSSVRRETAFAFRTLTRTPAFSLIAFVTLSLGIAATTAIFTVVDAVVLRPLPYRNANQLVSVLHPTTVPGNGERRWGLSPAGYFYFKDNSKSFRDLGVYRTMDMTLTGDGPAEVVRVGRVTSGVFRAFDARPYLGQLFNADNDKPSGAMVAGQGSNRAPMPIVISYELWQRRFGSDRDIVGRVITGDGTSRRIIGVAEPGLTLPMPGPFSSASNLAGFGVDIWLPQALNPAGPFENTHPFVGIARLKDGVSIDEANAEIAAFTGRFPEIYPQVYPRGFMKNYSFRSEVAPLKDSVLGPTVPKTLWALFGSVVLVLLIAVANVANLFVVRIETRRREATIRTALGADRVHMATHYLSESLLLCAAAGVVGILLAAAGLRVLIAAAPRNIPRLSAVTMSWPSVGFGIGLAVVLGVIFGLMPLLRRALDLSVLREGGRGLSASRSQRAFRGGLVVTQMALALILLSSAGLMIRSFMELRSVKPGFDPSNVLAFDLSLPFTEYDTAERAAGFYRQLNERLAAVPGVTSVSGVSGLPLEAFASGCSVVFRENRPYGPNERGPCPSGAVYSPGFFETLRIPLNGRAPTWADFDSRAQAVVITKALADRLWPGEDPIGKGLNNNGPAHDRFYRVFAVIPELRAEGLDRPPVETVFYPGTNLRDDRRTDNFNYQTILVRTSGAPPLSLAPTFRRIVAELNPRVPFQDARTMDMVVARSTARTSFIMILLGISAAFALLLSAVGMYGVISYLVTQRRFEIGVRIALGARVTQVARLVVMQSLSLACVGVAIGLAGSVAMTKVISSMLFGVTATDPLVMGTVVSTLLGIAGAASAIPARRAMKIDPIDALRAD
jgi:putative ABC transport system permease protein